MAEPQAEKTNRDRLQELLQGGIEKSGFRFATRVDPKTGERYGITPEKISGLITGGDKSPLPMGIGVADFVPFLGTALGTEDAIQGLKEAKESAQKGDYIGAGVDAAFGAVGLIPGAAGTAKYGRKAINAMRNIDLSKIPALMRPPTHLPTPAIEQGMAKGGSARSRLAELLADDGAHMAAGGRAKALVKSVLKPDAPAVNRIEMGFKDVTKRIPELTEAANLVKAGKMSAKEFEQLVNYFKPVTPYDFVPKPATRKEAMGALKENQRDLYGVPSKTLEEGYPVGGRLDISAYKDHGVWVPTVHEQTGGFGAGRVIGHESVMSLKDPSLGMHPEAALSIAAGSPKGTIATIKGDWDPVSDEEAVALAREYLRHKDWVQAGMDPERHSYFYDRRSMDPVLAGDHAYQIGPLVLVKNPKYGDKKDFKYAAGGEVHMARGGKAKAMLKSAIGRGRADIREPQTTTSITKEGGGNWLAGSVEGAMKPLKRGVDDQVTAVRNPATGAFEYLPATPDPMNQWIDKQLTRYVKNQMATKEDPIRALAEKGNIHVDPDQLNFNPFTYGKYLGAGQKVVAQSPTAKSWEGVSDLSISPTTARQLLGKSDDWVPDMGDNIVNKNPWLNKVPEETSVYGMSDPQGVPSDLGFDHLIDELRNATNPASGLPRELLIKPESLSKLSVPQAVERVAKINEWRAAQKAEADVVRARNPATFLHKDYPDKGYSWQELRMPEAPPKGWTIKGTNWIDPEGGVWGDKTYKNSTLEDALKYEGETMGHCVGGYCPDVASGSSRIYSLRDAKGQPHVTMKTSPRDRGELSGDALNEMEPGLFDKYLNQRHEENGIENMHDWLRNARPELAKSERIVQIKGKSNKKPNEEYLPFVQDFVKSGKWSDVGDFHNTGLMRIAPESNEALYLQRQNKPIPEYVSDQEYEEIRRGITDAMRSPYGAADEGMKRGGEVHMKKGGKAKGAIKSGLRNMLSETTAPPPGVEPIVVRTKDEQAIKKAYSDKVLATATARFEDKIARENPKLSAEDVSKKARAQATKKLDWERVNKPMLEKDYGPLVKSSYSSSNPNKMQNTPDVVSERMRKANEFLDQPTEPWRPPSPELQAFDRSSIRDALEGFPDVEQSKFPRDIPGRASTAHVDELYSDPANRALIEKQVKRGLPLGGETFYASLYPVKQAVLEAGGSPEMFEKWVHSLAPASARNSILNENAVGQLMRDMNARGIPLTDENVVAEMAKYKEKYGIGLPLMPIHRQGVANVLEGGANLRDMNRANVPTNYKIPTYGSQKAGDFKDSVVLDVHEAAGQSQGSRYHPYFREQGGFGNAEYNAGEQGLLGIAGDLGIPGGMAQAGRWFGGGELTGLKSPRGDALDLIEKQIAYTLQQQGKQPNPTMIRNELLNQIMTGEGALLPWYKKDPLPDVRQTGLQRKEGGAVTGDQHFVGGGATKKRAKTAVNKMLGRTPADVSRAYATPEYIPGRGVGHLEGLVDESFGVRKGFSEQASNAFKDAQGRDVLHGALGLNPIPTRSMTGAFRPSGDIPFAGGRLGGPSVSGRLPMETQPGFALGNDINITARKGVPKSTQNKLTAAEAIRGGMTGQHGSPWNMQIPSRKGNSLFVDLEGPVDPERMGLSAALQNGEGALADTGSGTSMINWGDKPSTKEAEVIANRLGGTGVTATKNISDYVDYSDQWMQPQGSGAVARKMLGYADELSPSDYRAISDAAMAPAGELHDLYEAISRTRNEATRADLMNMLRILRNKGLPGIAAGLAAGEAFPAEQSKRSGGLACLQCNPAHD